MIATDNYVDTSVGLNVWNKVLCKASGKVYLFEAQRLFEYDNDKWTNIGETVVPDQYLLSYLIRDDEDIYFVLSDYGIYRFNASSKKLENLYTLNY